MYMESLKKSKPRRGSENNPLACCWALKEKNHETKNLTEPIKVEEDESLNNEKES
jgi:hypothetical protein